MVLSRFNLGNLLVGIRLVESSDFIQEGQLGYNMILGITGRSGAGKGTIVEYLVKKHGFKHYSIRGYLKKEIDRRGLLSNRDTMTEMANEIRAKHGAGYISQQILGEALLQSENSVIESIRSVADAKYLKSHGAQIWAVDADIQERFKRITQRGSETDQVSFDEFVVQEEREKNNNNPTKANIAGVIKLADTVLYNNETTEELYAKVEAALLIN